MRLHSILTAAVMVLLSAECALAQKVDTCKTFLNTGNPLIKDKFTADPAPMVYGDMLYLYVGHDE